MTTDANQTKAWIVPVWTSRIEVVGRPVLVCYIAGFATAGEAIAAVKKQPEVWGSDEVCDPSPLSDETAKALGVTSGAVWVQ